MPEILQQPVRKKREGTIISVVKSPDSLRDVIGEVTERIYAEKIKKSIEESLKGKNGHGFFKGILRILNERFDLNCAMIGRIVGSAKVEVFSIKKVGRIVYDYTSTLSGTFWAEVAEKGYCAYSEGVRDLYANDKQLLKLKAEGLIGASLHDKDSKAIGILCATSSGRIDHSPETEQMMNVLADSFACKVSLSDLENIKKRDKLGEIAHDLSNVLTAIIGYTLILEEKCNTRDNIYELISKIEENVGRGNKLTKRLYDISQENKTCCKSCSSDCSSG